MWDLRALAAAAAAILILSASAAPPEPARGSPPLSPVPDGGAPGGGPTRASRGLVPIRVRNWLDFDRVDEPVTSGIALPAGAASDEGEMRLLDGSMSEVPAQFRVLARWPDGSVRWVLADFQCSVGAGSEVTYYLELGRAPSGFDSPLRVEDRGDRLWVHTGPLSFGISRGGFPLLGPFYMDLDGDGSPETLVSEGGDFEVTGIDGDRFLAGPGVEEVGVEEAGGLRLSVVVRGTHAGPTGRLLNYTLRINAYARKSYLRIYYTEGNDLPCLNDGSGQPDCLKLGSPNGIRFEDLSLELNLTSAGGEPTFSIPVEGGGTISGPLRGSALVYQDSSGGREWDRWPGVAFRGYEVVVDGRRLGGGSRAEGWADLSLRDFGLTVGERYFWENFPGAIELTGDGTVRLGLMPGHFSLPFEHRAGERKTHEIFLYFHGGPFDGSDAEVARALSDPLQARGPADLYLRFGLYERWFPADPSNPRLLDYELNNLAAVAGSSGPYAANLFDARERADFYGWMNFGDVPILDEDGGTGQMNLQYDFEYGMLVQSLRLLGVDDQNSRRWWLLGEQAARHTADLDVLHVHRGDPSQPSSYWIRWCWGGMFWHTPHGEDGLDRPHRGASPSLEFQFVRGLFLYYYLSGYRPAWDAAIEVSENTYWRVVNGPGEPGYSGTEGDEARAPANALRILLAAYQATWDGRFLEAARRVVRESDFRRRWYRRGPSPDRAGRSVAPWQQAMLMVSLGEYLDLIREVGGEVDGEARSSLLGYADWMLRYAYHPSGDDAFSGPHFVYRWWGDGRVSDWSPGGGANAWMLVISDAFAYAWRYSGNLTYLRVAAQQFRDGSRWFWYEGNPVGEFATGKQHAILSTSGFMFGRMVASTPAPGARGR